MNHIPREKLLSYLNEKLPAEDSRAIEAHLDSCHDCAERLRTIVDSEVFPLAAMVPHRNTDNDDGASPEATAPNISIPGYRIVRVIGQGGMGAVYEAFDEKLDRRVALKVVRSHLQRSDESFARFESEAKAAAKLNHAGLVRVLYSGEHRGLLFFTMEFVDGPTLADRLRASPLEADAAASLLRDLVDALCHAHRQGVVHRDIKPANIVLTKPRPEDASARWRPVVVDFGIAKSLEQDGPTRTGQILGSPNYMAPEQAGENATVDHRADIYALGGVLYAMLTGRPPFQAAREVETIRQVLDEDPPPPRQLNRSIPVELEAIALRCLEKKPEKRYQTAELLRDELDRFLQGLPVRAARWRPIRQARRLIQRNRIAIVGLFVLIVVVGSGLWALVQTQLAQERNRISLVSEAARLRISGREGQRFRSLDLIRKVVQSGGSLDPELATRLRGEAIASLSLADVRPRELWQVDPESTFAVDAQFEQFAYAEADRLLIEHVGGGGVKQSFTTGFTTITHLEFSRDGALILAADHSPGNRIALLQVYSIESGEPVFSGEVQARDRSWAFGIDVLAVLPEPGRIRLYDLTDSTVQPRTLLVEDFGYGCMAFSPDGKTLGLLKARPSEVILMDVASGDAIDRLPQVSVSPHDDTNASAITWSADGRQLAAATRYSINVWSLRDKRRLAVFDADDTDVVQLCFNQAGDVLASCADSGAVNLWDLTSQRRLLQTRGKPCLRFSKDDSRLAGAVSEHGSGLWEVALGREFKKLRGAEVRHNSATLVDFDASGRFMLSASLDGVKLWEIEGDSIRPSRTLSTRCESARFDVDGSSVVANTNSDIFYWHADQTALIDPAKGPHGRISLLEFNPTTWAGNFEISRDGSVLAITIPRRNSTLVVDLIRDEQSVLATPNEPTRIAISPDGKTLASCGTDATRIWNLNDGSTRRTLHPRDAAVRFSPDGRWLVTGSRTEYVFWNTDEWKERFRIDREGRLATGHIAFSEDSQFAALAGDGRVILIDMDRGEPVAHFTPPEALMISDLAFSLDSKWLAMGCNDHVVQVWNLAAIIQQLEHVGLAQALHDALATNSTSHPPDHRMMPPAFKDYDPNEGRPQVRILMPSGGSFRVGDIVTIRAEAEDDDGLSHNQYLLYQGETRIGMLYDSAQNSGFRSEFVWKIQPLLDGRVLDGDGYRIKVAVWDRSPRFLSAGAFSQTPFTIRPAAKIADDPGADANGTNKP